MTKILCNRPILSETPLREEDFSTGHSLWACSHVMPQKAIRGTKSDVIWGPFLKGEKKKKESVRLSYSCMVNEKNHMVKKKISLAIN